MQPSEPYPQGSLVLHHLECTIDCHNEEQMELTAGSITSYMSHGRFPRILGVSSTQHP